MINGIINVYKEKGFTSFDVVAKMRGMFHQKKIGHTGTLDPDATGVLPVCMGRATKVCDLLTDKDKVYEAVLLLGVTTDTQDLSGKILREETNIPDAIEVEKTILSFVGDYDQIPPMYSALKINGQKLCDLARKGITVERKARPVTIFAIDILEIDLPLVRMQVHCSKGTYIRTLCQDIGDRLGCGGCMKALTRTRVSAFELKDAWTLGQLQKYLADNNITDPQDGKNLPYPFVYSVDSVFLHLPQGIINKEAEKLLRNGNKIPENMTDLADNNSIKAEIGENCRLYDWNRNFAGIYKWTLEEGCRVMKPVKMFMDDNL